VRPYGVYQCNPCFFHLLQNAGADDDPLTGSEDEADKAANNNSNQPLQQSFSMVKTHLQLGHQSFNRTAPNIFDFSRNSSLLDSLQETLLSPQHGSSSSSQMFSPHVTPAQLEQLDSVSAAAALSKAASLRHTPALAQMPAAVQEVLQQCGTLFIEDSNIEGLAGDHMTRFSSTTY
jgi:hypothetical protein